MKLLNYQTISGSCGPLAIANFLRFIGHEISCKAVIFDCLNEGKFDGTGMDWDEIQHMLQYYGLDFYSFQRADRKEFFYPGIYMVTRKGRSLGHFIFFDGQKTYNKGSWAQADIKRSLVLK